MNIEKMLKSEAKNIKAPDLKVEILSKLDYKPKKFNYFKVLIPTSLALASVAVILSLNLKKPKENNISLLAKESLSLGIFTTNQTSSYSNTPFDFDLYANELNQFLDFSNLYNTSTQTLEENYNGYDYSLTIYNNDKLIQRFSYNEKLQDDEYIIEGVIEIDNKEYITSGVKKIEDDEEEISLELKLNYLESIKVEKELEKTEQELKYTYLVNGKKIKEIEYEENDSEINVKIAYADGLIDFDLSIRKGDTYKVFEGNDELFEIEDDDDYIYKKGEERKSFQKNPIKR